MSTNDDFALIGRRTIPLSLTEIPPTGLVWTGPVRFKVFAEGQNGYRWQMVTGDAYQHHLACSQSTLPTAEDCETQIRGFAPGSPIERVS